MPFPSVPPLDAQGFLTLQNTAGYGCLHSEAHSLNKFSVENFPFLSIPLPHATSSCPRIRHPEPRCQASQKQAGSLGELQLQLWFCLAIIAFNEVVQDAASSSSVGIIPLLQENHELPDGFLFFDRSHDQLCLEKSEKEVKKGF